MITIKISEVIFILLIHFLADFGLQTDDQANNKSTSNKYLFYHVGVYAMIWFIAIAAFTGSWVAACAFASITFVMHYVTDYITSRVAKGFFSKQDRHNGFITVGFDQVLHYIQLLLTFWCVSNIH